MPVRLVTRKAHLVSEKLGLELFRCCGMLVLQHFDLKTRVVKQVVVAVQARCCGQLQETLLLRQM